MNKTVCRILGVLVGALAGYIIAQFFDYYLLSPLQNDLQEVLKGMQTMPHEIPGLTENFVGDEIQNLKLYRIVKVIILVLGFVVGYLASGLLGRWINRMLSSILEGLQKSSKERII